MVRRAPVIGIDIIRFLAATSVVAWHFAAKPFLTPEGSTLHPLLPMQAQTPAGVAFSWWGWVGVQIFFVVSGAVIAYSVEGATARSFFFGRVARLWPAMFICASICASLSLIFWHTSIERELLLYVSSLLFNPIGPWVSGQIWTLPVEIVFYAIIWTLIALDRTQWMEPLAWILAIISALYWTASDLMGHPLPGGKYLQLLLILHGCYFAMGMIIAKITTERFTLGRSALLLLCIFTAALEISGRARIEMEGAPYNFDVATPCAIWLVCVFSIWASMTWRDAIADWMGRGGSFFKMLGMMTYPLYLVHYQTGGPLFAALYSRGAPLWSAFCAAYIVAVIAAFIISRWLEPVLRRFVISALQTIPALRAPPKVARPGF